ncbi:MAG TPA: sn-glycerol-3-phosphate ABC transporter ATP-binding protein UgpC [Steroidobacteraceae bacterium]
MARSSVQLDRISRRFGNTVVIDDVSLDIEPGEFVVFVGPSGCGKSTLLRLIAGLETPSTGRIHIDGRDVTDVHPSKRGVAMVFQSYALYPHMSVAENMGFGLKMQGMPKAEIRERVRRAAEILQLETLLDRKPRALSGGQRQRVAIGRAIVREPDVFLFDEPLSNLDAALRGQMRIEIARLHERLGTTMIYVTHDQVEAMTLASRIVVLNGGRIEQVGRPMDLYKRPANMFVAGFIGAPRMNFLQTIAVRCRSTSVEVRLADHTLEIPRAEAQVSPGTPLTLGVRPEDFTLGASDSGLSLTGQVSLIERLGSEALVYVRLQGIKGEPVTARLAGDAPVSVGGVIELGIHARACHLFDEIGRAIGAPASQPSANRQPASAATQ